MQDPWKHLRGAEVEIHAKGCARFSGVYTSSWTWVLFQMALYWKWYHNSSLSGRVLRQIGHLSRHARLHRSCTFPKVVSYWDLRTFICLDAQLGIFLHVAGQVMSVSWHNGVPGNYAAMILIHLRLRQWYNRVQSGIQNEVQPRGAPRPTEHLLCMCRDSSRLFYNPDLIPQSMSNKNKFILAFEKSFQNYQNLIVSSTTYNWLSDSDSSGGKFMKSLYYVLSEQEENRLVQVFTLCIGCLQEKSGWAWYRLSLSSWCNFSISGCLRN